MYIVEGPRGMGNVFGHYRANLLAKERFAIVEDCEYANGGYGPSTVDGIAYKTRQNAEDMLARLELSNAPND
jgi:hypothetical protein